MEAVRIKTYQRYSVESEGRSYQNIRHCAESLGLNVKSIYKQVHRALAKGNSNINIAGKDITVSVIL